MAASSCVTSSRNEGRHTAVAPSHHSVYVRLELRHRGRGGRGPGVAVQEELLQTGTELVHALLVEIVRRVDVYGVERSPGPKLLGNRRGGGLGGGEF